MSAISEIQHAASQKPGGKRCVCNRRATRTCDETTTIRDMEDEGRAKTQHCDRAVCDYCVKVVTDLDLCMIHARLRNIATTENKVLPPAARVRQAIEDQVGNLYAHDPEVNRAARQNDVPAPVRETLPAIDDIEIPDAFASEEA